MSLFNRFSPVGNSGQEEVINPDKTDGVGFLAMVREKFNELNGMSKNYVRWGMVTVVAVFFIAFLLSLYHRDNQLTHLVLQMESKRNVLLGQLGDIHTQLDKLTVNAPDSGAQPELLKISNELVDVEKNVNGVAKSAELQKIMADMDLHFNDLEKTVATSSNSKQYLDVKALPFTVIAIDVISQQPFVSVDYDHHVTPLGVGDSLAGWKVVDANYGAVEVEFKNDQGQYVRINTVGKTASAGDKL